MNFFVQIIITIKKNTVHIDIGEHSLILDNLKKNKMAISLMFFISKQTVCMWWLKNSPDTRVKININRDRKRVKVYILFLSASRTTKVRQTFVLFRSQSQNSTFSCFVFYIYLFILYLLAKWNYVFYFFFLNSIKNKKFIVKNHALNGPLETNIKLLYNT